MRGLLSIILTLALLFSFTPVAYAADSPKTSAPTEGIPANGPVGSAEGHRLYAMALASGGINLTDYRNSITEQSSANLQLYGATDSDAWADRLEVNFTLQQWSGSAWVSYSTSNNYTTYNNSYQKTINRLVSHGYYYRVKTVHRAFLDSDSDEATLYSSYIYVS